jgi:cytochrome c553
MTEQNQKQEQNGSVAGHAVVWAITVVVSLFVFRLLRIFALDFETLIANVARDSFRFAVWIPLGRSLIVYGPLPLTILTISASGYRLLGRRLNAGNPLDRISTPLRRALKILSYLLFLAAAAPLSAAFGVWLSVEAFAWIQWYENIRPIITEILLVTPMIAGPALALLGLGALILVVGQKADKTSRTKKVLRNALGVAMVLFLLIFAALGTLHGSRVALTPGVFLFEKSCNTCHSRSRPLYFVKTPAEWERTVKKMRNQEGAELDDSDERAIVGFLSGMRSYSDRWTFASRCLRCHGFSGMGWEDRRPEEWKAIVARVSRHSPYYYRGDVQDQIVAHLVATRSDEETTLGLPAEQYERFSTLGRTCNRCHSISRSADRYRDANPAEMLELVRRMSQKSGGDRIAPKESFFASTYTELMAQEGLFETMFPHDMIADREALPW